MPGKYAPGVSELGRSNMVGVSIGRRRGNSGNLAASGCFEFPFLHTIRTKGAPSGRELLMYRKVRPWLRRKPCRIHTKLYYCQLSTICRLILAMSSSAVLSEVQPVSELSYVYSDITIGPVFVYTTPTSLRT